MNLFTVDYKILNSIATIDDIVNKKIYIYPFIDYLIEYFKKHIKNIDIKVDKSTLNNSYNNIIQLLTYYSNISLICKYNKTELMTTITENKVFMIKFYINIIKDLIYNINTYLYAENRYKDLIKTIEFYILLDNLVNFLYNNPDEFSYNSITFNENFNDTEITDKIFNNYLSAKATDIIYYNKNYYINNVTKYIVIYMNILLYMNITTNVNGYINLNDGIDSQYNDSNESNITIYGNNNNYIIYNIYNTSSNNLEEFKAYIIEYLDNYLKDSIILAQNLNSLNISIDSINNFIIKIKDIIANANNIDKTQQDFLKNTIKLFIAVLYYNKKFIDVIKCIEFYKLLEILFNYYDNNIANFTYDKITGFFIYVYFPKEEVEKFKKNNIKYFPFNDETTLSYNVLLNLLNSNNYFKTNIHQNTIYKSNIQRIINKPNNKQINVCKSILCAYMMLNLKIIIESLYKELYGENDIKADIFINNFVIIFKPRSLNNYVKYFINIFKEFIYNINTYLYKKKRYKDLIMCIDFYILLNNLANFLYDESIPLSYNIITFNDTEITDEIFNEYLSTKDTNIIYYNEYISKDILLNDILSYNIIYLINIINNTINSENIITEFINNKPVYFSKIVNVKLIYTDAIDKMIDFKDYIIKYLDNYLKDSIILAQNLNSLNISIDSINNFIIKIKDIIANANNIDKTQQDFLKNTIKLFIAVLYYNKKFIDVIKCIEFYKLLEILFNYYENTKNSQYFNITDFNIYTYFSKEEVEKFKNNNIKYFPLLQQEIIPYKLLLKMIESSNLSFIVKGGTTISKYKSTGNKITVLYKKNIYTRVIYINNRKKYIKINKVFILLSKLKKI